MILELWHSLLKFLGFVEPDRRLYVVAVDEIDAVHKFSRDFNIPPVGTGGVRSITVMQHPQNESLWNVSVEYGSQDEVSA